MAQKKYNYAVGRRKHSTAVVKLYPKGKGNMNIIRDTEKMTIEDYFGGHKYLIEDVYYPFYIIGQDTMKSFDAEIKVSGGWIRGQAEAMRLALARALVDYNFQYRTELKPYWLLKRDSRKKERKKPWLKKARRSPQWSKR